LTPRGSISLGKPLGVAEKDAFAWPDEPSLSFDLRSSTGMIASKFQFAVPVGRESVEVAKSTSSQFRPNA